MKNYGLAGGPWPEDYDWTDDFLRGVVDQLHARPSIVVAHSEFGHYGSGYASFVECVVTLRDGSARTPGTKNSPWGPSLKTEGFTVLLSRLAPVAALAGPTMRFEANDGNGSSQDLPHASSAAEDFGPRWEVPVLEVRAVLESHGIVLLPLAVLCAPLPPALHVETNLGEPPYTVFDAWFHWMD
ncbi:MAG: hypothetical protein ACT4QG_19650 [Sporichthyaceae bacterium]